MYAVTGISADSRAVRSRVIAAATSEWYAMQRFTSSRVGRHPSRAHLPVGTVGGRPSAGLVAAAGAVTRRPRSGSRRAGSRRAVGHGADHPFGLAAVDSPVAVGGDASSTTPITQGTRSSRLTMPSGSTACRRGRHAASSSRIGARKVAPASATQATTPSAPSP